MQVGTSLTDDDTHRLCEAKKKGDDAVRALEKKLGKSRAGSAQRKLDGAALRGTIGGTDLNPNLNPNPNLDP